MAGSRLTAIIEREGPLFIARCMEFDIASQGSSAATAMENLKRAVASFAEHTENAEIQERLARDVKVRRFEIRPS